MLPLLVDNTPSIAPVQKLTNPRGERAVQIESPTSAEESTGWESYIDSSSAFAGFSSSSYTPDFGSSTSTPSLSSSLEVDRAANEYLHKPMRNFIEDKVKAWKASSTRSIRLFVSSTFR